MQPQGTRQKSPISEAQKAEASKPPIRTMEIADIIKGKFPEVTIDYIKERRVKLTVPPEKIREIAVFVRDDLGFDHISTVSGVDWIAKGEFEVIYFLGNLRPGYEDVILALAERVKRDNPIVQSLIDVWVGVDYHERETFEMFGIIFKGHPNQSKFLLPEDWSDIPPLRKDFVSPGR